MRFVYTLITILILSQSFEASANDLKLLQLSTPFKGSTLYVPNDGKPHAGIVMLHGSEGGSLPYANGEAQFLAAHGYAVLSFCWYNCAKKPISSPVETLENIELQKTIDAIAWLKTSEHVRGNKIALLGWSRGGEQAVLLGSINEAANIIDAIAVHTPSDTVVSGFSWAAMDKRCWICENFDLACFNSSNDPFKWNWPKMKWNPSCGSQPKMPDDTQSWLLKGAPVRIGSTIEIEKFKKPLFITVGDKDELWDFKKSVRLEERLKRFNQPVELHVFSGERHNFSDVNENRRHALLLRFLKRSL